MLRFLRAVSEYLCEEDRNLLGFRVTQQYRAPTPRPVRQAVPPKMIFPPEKPFTPSLPPVVREPTRFEQLQKIEQEFQEDLYMVQMLSDPLTQQAALAQANRKRRSRIARLIG